MNLIIDKLTLKKPSLYFFIAIIISFIILLSIGDTTWRHVDDYGPLKSLFEADSLKDYLKLFSMGWGTYPPIWEYFTFTSYFFKFLGIDAVRFFCFLFGFFSLILSSFLTYSICYSIKNFSSSQNNIRPDYSLETFSVLVNFLNPEIILHSNSNMPYNLSTITIQAIIFLIINIIKFKKVSNNKNYYLNIKCNNFILFTIFTALFTFQSTIIFCSLLITLIFYLYNFQTKLSLNYFTKPLLVHDTYKDLFKDIKQNYIKNFFYIILSFFILMYIIKLFLIIFYFQKQPGPWSYGINDVYKISNIKGGFLENFSKIIFSFKSILTQSIYPIRLFQVRISNFIFIFYLYSLISLTKKNLAGNYFSIFSIFTVLITVFLSYFGNFVFAPTRHTIFLYPLFWTPLIIKLDFILDQIKYKLISNIFLVLLYLSFSIGSIISIKEISYNREDYSKLISLLKDSNFYLENSYRPFNDLSLSDMKFNGTKEFYLTNNKKCSFDKINNYSEYKIFIYNHRFPFKNDEENLKYLFYKNKECFSKNNSISILDKIERKNPKDIEQNNLIFNGGSSLYAYLIQVKNKNS